MKTRDLFLEEIENNWKTLGYTSKPDKFMALTYDDGPSDFTEDLLKILKEKNVKATFFVIGNNVNQRPVVTRRIRDEGHELANHSQGHPSMGELPIDDSVSQIESCNEAIYLATNADGKPVKPVLFRPPNLSKGENLFSACVKMGFPLIEGTLSYDYVRGHNSGSGEAQANAILDNADNWNIALNHDPRSGKPEEILKAVSLMIDGLRAKGFYLLTVSELITLSGVNAEPGKVYQDFKKP